MALKEYNIIEDLGPAGGWTFYQRHNGVDVKITASSGKALVTAVEDFRINNGIPLGDTEGEVANAIALASPANVPIGRKIKPPKITKDESFKPLIERIRRWFDAIIPRRPKFCDQWDADERAEVCKGCPMNVRWKVQGCGRCNSEVEYRSEIMRGGRESKHDFFLMGCRVMNVELKAFVHLDIDELPEASDKAPAKCWLHDIKPNQTRRGT